MSKKKQYHAPKPQFINGIEHPGSIVLRELFASKQLEIGEAVEAVNGCLSSVYGTLNRCRPLSTNVAITLASIYERVADVVSQTRTANWLLYRQADYNLAEKMQMHKAVNEGSLPQTSETVTETHKKTTRHGKLKRHAHTWHNESMPYPG